MNKPSSSKPTYTIAVRALVEHVLRSGDLRYDFVGSVRAVEGIRAHQHIQSQRPPDYQAEVPVAHVVDTQAFELCVTGRIDGLLIQNSGVVVEEIKTTRRSLDELEENPNAVHWGQAKCYAYIWASQHHQGEVTIRLTYVNPDSGRVREIERLFDFGALTVFFKELLARYTAWMASLVEWEQIRDRSIADFGFPFENYRPGQREMAVAVYRNIRVGGHLLLQAATGIGKTMGALFPAVKALGEALADKVVFLTARTTGRLAAEAALQTMRSHGLKLKSISLTAKDKICFHDESVCAPEECDYAKGHFDRINDALSDALQEDALTREAIEAVALHYQVCPFEFSLELISWCDCVICDYNYAFAPGVMLHRLFGEEGGDHAVLVDEAHNLVDRSREMFSAQLGKQDLLVLRRRIKDDLPGLYRCLGRINAWLAAMRRKCRDAGNVLVENILPEALMERLKDFLWQAEKWLVLRVQKDYREALLERFFEVARFVKIAEGFDAAYAVIYKCVGDELTVRQYCVDPADLLDAAWKRCQSAVLFSATLSPAGYFKSILCCREDAVALNLPSPFPPANLGVFVADRITTLYRERENSCGEIAQVIVELIGQRTGHYMVFFPSYEYLRMVHAEFLHARPHVDVIVQAPEMAENQRIAFLDRFNEHVSQTLVGFAVMGGIFGEGIDLQGEQLAGAVIVGVGLPGVCIERDLIKGHFDRKNGNGFEFAYQYPGVNRVLQAAGRVIRSETDRGVILLVDRRYRENRYRNLLPPTWELSRINEVNVLNEKVRSFWWP
ncbi:MAG: ATP-dependent DNA helicase [Desulfobacteraceae bacterium]